MCYSMAAERSNSYLVDGSWFHIGYKIVQYDACKNRLLAFYRKDGYFFSGEDYEYKFGEFHTDFKHGIHVAPSPSECEQYLPNTNGRQFHAFACIKLLVPEMGLLHNGHVSIAYLPPPPLNKFDLEVSKPLGGWRKWYDFRADNLTPFDIAQIRNKKDLWCKHPLGESQNYTTLQVATAFNARHPDPDILTSPIPKTKTRKV